MPQEQQPTDTSNRKEGDADKRTLLTVFARLVLPESLRNMFGMSNYGRNFPLHRAVERRDVERVRRLLQGGIKPDVRDNHQVTALMLAAERGYDEIVEVLIKAGANVNAKNRPSAFEEGRRSALHRACEAGKVSTVKLLLELGADSNCLSQSQWSPLYVALFWRKPEVAICLLEHGANPNGPEKSLEPPLVTAASNNDLRMLKELLQRGADPNCGALAATTSVECVRELLEPV